LDHEGGLSQRPFHIAMTVAKNADEFAGYFRRGQQNRKVRLARPSANTNRAGICWPENRHCSNVFCYDVQPEVHQMGDKVWQLPKEQFIAIWNASETLTEAAERIKQTVSGAAPRWAGRARAGQLRHEGIELKPLPTTASAA
jgi:hypothetical protein